MKVLLTGASGYVGSELLLELIASSHQITCVARKPDKLSESIGCDTRVRVIAHDLSEPLNIPDDDFDLVIRAAGANDVVSFDPSIALSQTVLSVRHVIEFASRQRIPRIIYVSTFQVYGRDEGRINETTECKPKSDYALTHLFAEQWVELFGRTRGLSWVIVRPANIAGIPRLGQMVRWSLVPGCFCLSAVQSQEIVLRTMGFQGRDFLPLSEVTRRIADIAINFKAYADGVVNICSGYSLTIREVARMASNRFRVLNNKNCDLRFEAPVEISNSPKALTITSRYQENNSAVRLTHEQVLEYMSACIDDTYQYIQKSL